MPGEWEGCPPEGPRKMAVCGAAPPFSHCSNSGQPRYRAAGSPTLPHALKRPPTQSGTSKILASSGRRTLRPSPLLPVTANQCCFGIQALSCPTMPGGSSHRVRVSTVLKLLLDTGNSVPGRVWTRSALALRLPVGRRWTRSESVAPAARGSCSASQTNRAPNSEPPIPMFTTSVTGEPRLAAPSAL